jgi:ABC-type transport system involved in multi-copper enzyme maturation permease subunit
MKHLLNIRPTFPMVALLRRELLTGMRRYRAYVCMALLVLVSVLVVLAQWPSNAQLFTRGASYARELLTWFGVVLVLGVGIFVPAMASTAIVGEKEQDTFDLLIVTLIRPKGIILAKLFNVVGLLILMIVAMLPVFASLFFLVGVEWPRLLGLFLIVLATTISCALIGIFWSCRLRSGVRAAIFSFVSVFMVMGGWFLIYLILLEVILPAFGGRALTRAIQNWIKLFVDPGTLAEFTCPLASVVVFFQGYRGSYDFVLWVVFFHGLVALFFFWLSLRILRRPPRYHNVGKSQVIDDAVALKKRRSKFPYYLIDPMRRKKMIEDHRNPILVKELRWGVGQRASVMVRSFYCAFIICLLFNVFLVYVGLISSGNTGRIYEYIIAIMGLEISFLLIVAPLFVTSALTKEREQGNLDMLRMTLLQPRSILRGKLLAGLVALSPMIFAIVLSTTIGVVASLFEVKAVIATLMGIVTLFVCVAVSISLSLLASVFAQRTATSLVTGYIFNIMAFFGIFFLAAMVSEISRSHVDEELLFSLSPVGAFVQLVGQFRDDNIVCWIVSMGFWSFVAFMSYRSAGKWFMTHQMRD